MVNWAMANQKRAKENRALLIDLDSSIKPDGLLDSFADLPDWWKANVKSGS